MSKRDDKRLLLWVPVAMALTGALVAAYGFVSAAQACLISPFAKPRPPTDRQRAFQALRANRLDEALRLFSKVGDQGWVARVRFQRASDLMRKNHFDAAADELGKAVKANPNHVGAQAALVDALRQSGAAHAALAAVASIPTGLAAEPAILAAKARALASLGRDRAAATILDALAKRDRLPLRDRPLHQRLHTRLVSPGALDRF